MKSVKLAILSVGALWLSACLPPTGQFFGDQVSYLRNDQGIVIAKCTNEMDESTGYRTFKPIQESKANAFWINNSLPKGTLYVVCEGEQAVLPKDCQGNSLTTPEIRRYWKKYNLPAGTTRFECSSGVPKVANDS